MRMTIECDGQVSNVDRNHLISAKKHAIRAYYDCFDYVLTVVTHAFDEIEKCYHKEAISIQKLFPDYAQWKQTINELRSSCAYDTNQDIDAEMQAQSKLSRVDREVYYKNLDDNIHRLMAIYHHIQTMAEMLSVEIEKNRRQARKDLRVFVVAIVTLMFTIVGVAVAIYK